LAQESTTQIGSCSPACSALSSCSLFLEAMQSAVRSSIANLARRTLVTCGAPGRLAGVRGVNGSIGGANVAGHPAAMLPCSASGAQHASRRTALTMTETMTQEVPMAAMTTAEEEQWITTASGLQYRDIKIGEGVAPVKGQTIFVHYTGRLENGKEFDSSMPRGQPLEFPVGTGRVIAGWDEGLLSMRVGGSRQLRIPARLAYGRRGAGGVIPPNATLLFDCELASLGQKPFLSCLFGFNL